MQPRNRRSTPLSQAETIPGIDFNSCAIEPITEHVSLICTEQGKGQKYILKKAGRDQLANEQQAANFNHYHEVHGPMTSENNESWFIQKYLPGQPLMDDEGNLNQAFYQSLSFYELTQVFAELAHQIRQLHRKHLLHLDIKPSHILVDKTDGEINVNLCGFTHSRAYRDITGFKNIISDWSPFYMPATALDNRRSENDDRYASVPFIAIALGGVDIFKKRKRFWKENKITSAKFFDQLFDHTGLFGERTVALPPKISLKIQQAFEAFLNRMRDPDPANQVTDEESCEFFDHFSLFTLAAIENRNTDLHEQKIIALAYKAPKKEVTEINCHYRSILFSLGCSVGAVMIIGAIALASTFGFSLLPIAFAVIALGIELIKANIPSLAKVGFFSYRTSLKEECHAKNHARRLLPME